MEIFINEKKYSIKDQNTISEMIRELEIKGNTGMAIAVNNSVIPKKDWENTKLCSGDNILLIHATSGG